MNKRSRSAKTGSGAGAGAGAGSAPPPAEAARKRVRVKHRTVLANPAGGSKTKSGYKTPPVASVLPGTQPLPTRNKHNQLVFPDFPAFRPNMSPKEVMQAGSFGGGYWRPITSAVTGKKESSNDWKEFPAEWFTGLDVKRQLTNPVYDKSANAYGVKCGGDLYMWESSGWISAVDPRGWFQWYCRFYQGRRSTDDDRQISRALGVMGPKGRFRNTLIGKCARSGKAFNDATVSPVIRQTLQHWGYVLTARDADRHVKDKGLPTLPTPDSEDDDDDE